MAEKFVKLTVDFTEPQIHWQQQAAFEAQKNRELRYQHGSGPCNVFILDTSSSLGEEGYNQMKEAFTSIIDEFSKRPDIDENVAVIVCGRETKFQRYFSNHYEDIKHCLGTIYIESSSLSDEVDFGGPSPLTAGFYLSTGCFVNGASKSHIVGEFHIRQRIILISDGRPTDFTSVSYSDDDYDVMESNEIIKDHLLGFTRNLGKIHPIFCIPVGTNPDLTMLEFISVQSRGGKIVHCHETRQFAKYSQNMKVASMLSCKMMNDGNDRERVMTSLVCKFPDEEFSEMDQDDIYEICSKKSLYGPLDNIRTDRDDDMDAFEERNPKMPPLGSRVKRGRDWNWDEQDSFGLGTVIGHCKKLGWLTVEWDTGLRNIYRYGTSHQENNVFDVQVCKEPRILRNEPISAGCEVTRGPDWEWENQDGGAGSIGSVITKANNCIVLVRWQNGFLDFQKALEPSKQLDPNASKDLPPKPILHVIKGKYFRNHSLSPDIETDSPSLSCAIGQWVWKDDTGKWNPYCREMNLKISRCYERDPKSTAIVTVQNQTYRVVMAKNIQINLATRETSDVKLVKSKFQL